MPRLHYPQVKRYAKRAVRHAKVEMIDGQWLATIEGFPGVWACEDTAIEALSVLEQVMFDWALLKMQDGDGDLPRLSGSGIEQGARSAVPGW